MNRRDFLGLSAAAAATFLAGSLHAANSRPPSSGSARGRKKGLGRTLKHPTWAERVTDLRCRWFYSWGATIPENLPDGLEFVPMIFRHGGNAEAIARVGAAAKAAGIAELLGFNEPDVANQANMSVEQALEAWPLLMETGLRLGSPACVHPDNEWMTAFMDGVKKRKLRVDFICVHSYGGPNAEALVRRMERIGQLYRRPVWITEFAVGDWKAKSPEENQHSPETVLRFMERVLPMLNRLGVVERYAWFSASPESAPLGTSALFDETGALTRLGRCYRDA